MYCFGCGKNGHQVRSCDEIASLIKKGVIIKDSYTGRLQWPDGSRIMRSGDETWAQAVANVRKANLVRIMADEEEESSQVCNYLNLAEPDEDSDSEDLTEADLTPGKIRDCYAYSAERTPKVSNEARKQVQFTNSPNSPQRVKKFSKGLEGQAPSRSQTPIQKNPNFNSNQARPPKRITPIDVHQNKFEGKSDNQFLPMQVEQEVAAKPSNNSGKNPPHQGRTNIPKISNPGTSQGRDSSAIVESILNSPLTLTVQEAVQISPKLRKDLVNAVKQAHEPSPPVLEKTTLVNEIVLGGESSDGPRETFCGGVAIAPEEKRKEGEIREGLLEVPAHIRGVPMTGIFDCGSQISIISKRIADQAGLPWSSDQESRIRLVTASGRHTRMLGKIPDAKIWLTDSNLPTTTDLYVNPGNGFDLLMGRSFGSRNEVNLKEKKQLW